jgi:hypothetical protein
LPRDWVRSRGNGPIRPADPSLQLHRPTPAPVGFVRAGSHVKPASSAMQNEDLLDVEEIDWWARLASFARDFL